MRKRGFTVIEILIYLAMLAMLLGVLITILFGIVNTYQKIEVERDLQVNGAVVMERMLREIRGAVAVDTVNSVLDSSPGVLSLDSLDSVGDPVDIEFSIVSGAISLSRGGVVIGDLTTDDIAIDSFIVRHIDGTNSDGVKIELTLTSSNGDFSDTQNFYITGLLRGSINDE